MKKIYLTLATILLTGCAQHNNALNSSEQNIEKNKPASVQSILNNARQLAGNDPYLTITQRKQCNELAPSGKTYKALDSRKNIIIEPYKVFDNLYFIGGTRTGSWLITTADGYIMVDAMFGDSPENVLIPGMKKLGLDPAQLKYILITHAGPDHVGGAKYFQETFGTRIIMSQQDWNGLLTPKAGSWVLDTRPLHQRPPPERHWLGPPALDIIAEPHGALTLGSTTIAMHFTPRRTNGGGLSFIVPVTDKGKQHMWATYGNAGAPKSLVDKQLHMKSLNEFIAYMESADVDSITSSHPFVDGSNLRVNALKNRKSGEENPFVIGTSNAKNYIKILEQCTALSVAQKHT